MNEKTIALSQSGDKDALAAPTDAGNGLLEPVLAPVHDKAPPDDLALKLANYKVLISVPCYRDMPVEFVIAMHGVRSGLAIPNAINLLGDHSLIPSSRNRLAADFLYGDWTHLLFIDSDIIFEPKHIVWLLVHDQPVVGGLYAIKDQTHKWCLNEKGFSHRWCLSSLVEPRPPGPNGLVEVRHTGAGFLAIKREVFEKMREAFGAQIEYTTSRLEREEGIERKEWDFFRVGVYHQKDTGRARYYSEDWYFCEMARELGYKVYVDPRVVLKHIGQAAYPLESQLNEGKHQKK
jgi:hypothetical protein